MIETFVVKNLSFYRKKVFLTTALVAALFFLMLAAFLFTQKIKRLADAPLQALQTEIIVQKDSANKSAQQIKTSGVIAPFNLTAFSKSDALAKLAQISGVTEVSTALVLWQFDLRNNRTIVGIDVHDPQIGLRKIQQWLMPRSRFFTDNNAREVIVERHFAKLFGFKRGGVYKINDADYTIVGIVDFKEQSNLANAQIFMPYGSTLALLGAKREVINQAYVSVADVSHLPAVHDDIARRFVGFSILTKDRLLKNVSSFHRLIYRFGNDFALAIATLALVLIFWVMKMHRMEFGGQTEILKFIGWPQKSIALWVIMESLLIVLLALCVGVVLALMFQWGFLSQMEIGVLPDHNFKL